MATLSITLNTPVRAHSLPSSGSSRRVELAEPQAVLRFYSASAVVIELASITDGASTGAGTTYQGGATHTIRVGRGEIGIGATASSQTVDVLLLEDGEEQVDRDGIYYDGARIAASADPSSLGVTLTDTQDPDGWLTLTWGATGATTGQHPNDGATFVFDLRDVHDTPLSAGISPRFASNAFGFDIDASVPDNCIVGMGVMDASTVAGASEFFGARLTESAGVYDVDLYTSVSAVNITGPQSGDPRRMWCTLGPFNDSQLRSACAFGAPASGVIDNEAATTGAFAITGLYYGVLWVGRLGTGAGSETLRIRPWTWIQDVSSIFRPIP